MNLKHGMLVCLLLLSLPGCLERTAPPAPVAEGWQQPASVQGAVRAGPYDSIYTIAWRYGHDHRELIEINHLTAPYRLHEGQVLYLVAPEGAALTSSEEGPVAVRVMGEDDTGATSSSAPAPMSFKPMREAEVYVKPAVSRQPPPHVEVKPKPVVAEPVHASVPRGSWNRPTQGRITMHFGPRSKGIDFAGSLGQPIYAATDGEVVYSGNGLPGYGNLIIVKHSDEYLSAYAHNNRLLVREGERVVRGQKIAEMGKTGTDQVKLHFELRQAGQAINPEPFFASGGQ